ncbi:MAG: hypothetical protein ACTSW4_06665 [Candidatus Ranarchaeia archaeon]
MPENPQVTSLSSINVNWVTRTKTLYGKLFLTATHLQFRTGVITFKTVEWEMPLNELSNILFVDGRIEVYSAGYYIALFENTGSRKSAKAFVEKSRNLIYKANAETGQITPVQVASTERLTNEMPAYSALDSLDNAIIDVIEAYRHSEFISFEQIFEIVNEEHDLTTDMLQLRLAHLIRSGYLSGYLSTKGYHRDTFIVFNCQICDARQENPSIYWQCPECFRFVCLECRKKFPRCPGHPDVPASLVKMPLRCSSCERAVVDLKDISDYLCPHCNEPFPPP